MTTTQHDDRRRSVWTGGRERQPMNPSTQILLMVLFATALTVLAFAAASVVLI